MSAGPRAPEVRDLPQRRCVPAVGRGGRGRSHLIVRMAADWADLVRLRSALCEVRLSISEETSHPSLPPVLVGQLVPV